MNKKYKVTYFYEGLNDYGAYTSGYNTVIISDKKQLEYYKKAENGHNYCAEYIQTVDIKEV